jgi:hypothetical protein
MRLIGMAEAMPYQELSPGGKVILGRLTAKDPCKQQNFQ